MPRVYLRSDKKKPEFNFEPKAVVSDSPESALSDATSCLGPKRRTFYEDHVTSLVYVPMVTTATSFFFEIFFAKALRLGPKQLVASDRALSGLSETTALGSKLNSVFFLFDLK